MADQAGGAVEAADEASHSHHEGFWALALGSVGVVFGDIGTSPLYSLQTAFSVNHNEVRVTELTGLEHSLKNEFIFAERHQRANPRARALYERLGFTVLDYTQMIDEAI